MIICVEGCNAVGKSHALAQFAERLQARGITFRIYKAPDYQGVHGTTITDFLAGRSLSGQYMYPDASQVLQRNQVDQATEDYKTVDILFRQNRDSVFARINEDQSRDPVQVILLDRWVLSAVVYSMLRFEDIGVSVDNQYYTDLITSERVPDVTLIIEEPAEVIVQRMQYRLQHLQMPAPKVWQQPAECYSRIMEVFRRTRDSLSSSIAVINEACYTVSSESIYQKLDHIVNTLSRQSL